MIPLNDTDRRVMALLRAALQSVAPEAAVFAQMTTDDWKAVYRLAARQGVMALSWDGVMQLPAESQPPRPVRLMWALEVQRYEERYARYVRTLDRLTRFYAGHHIRCVQMKGVGLSSYYPVPAHREGGDIDIFTFSADPAQLTDEAANRLADTLMMDRGIEVDLRTSKKHSHFDFEGISVENHKMFLNADRYALAGRLNPVLRRLMQPERIELACGPEASSESYSVWIAPAAFNALFVPFHAIQHYGSGLSLHHLADWACVVRHPSFVLPAEAQAEPRFLCALRALTLLATEWLGVEFPASASAWMQPDAAAEKLACEMAGEMLHPRFERQVPNTSWTGILWYKCRRYAFKGSQADRVLGMSPVRRFFSSVVQHVKRPETILGRGIM